LTEHTAISLLWATVPANGRVRVSSGGPVTLEIRHGSGEVDGDQFTFATDQPARLEITADGAILDHAPGATIVRIDSTLGAFSFFLRDVEAAGPLVVPDCSSAIVTSPDDRRTFAEIAGAATIGKRSGIQQMAEDPEETYDNAASLGRTIKLPAILGLGRDARVFLVVVDPEGGHWGCFRAGYGHYPVFLTYPHAPNDPRFEYFYVLGRGMGCQLKNERRLEIRLPHPDGPRNGTANDGCYAAERESVIIEDFSGEAEVSVVFEAGESL